jgi:hypothetical protein
MKWIETVLYVLGFFGLVIGLRLLLIQNREVASMLQQSIFERGPQASRMVAQAVAISQKGQTAGAWIALAGGSLGLAATVLTVWTS